MDLAGLAQAGRLMSFEQSDRTGAVAKLRSRVRSSPHSLANVAGPEPSHIMLVSPGKVVSELAMQRLDGRGCSCARPNLLVSPRQRSRFTKACLRNRPAPRRQTLQPRF
jgi:hypothetical protein